MNAILPVSLVSNDMTETTRSKIIKGETAQFTFNGKDGFFLEQSRH